MWELYTQLSVSQCLREKEEEAAPSVQRTRSSPWLNPKRLAVVYGVHYKTVISWLHVVHACREERERLGFTRKKEDARACFWNAFSTASARALLTASGVKTHTREKY